MNERLKRRKEGRKARRADNRESTIREKERKIRKEVKKDKNKVGINRRKNEKPREEGRKEGGLLWSSLSLNIAHSGWER